MDEYIKKDELLKFKADVYDEDGHVLYAVPTGCIVAMPPADVTPVRHGRWEKKRGLYSCSECGKTCPYDVQADVIEYWACNYCPHCGAKMDGGNQNV